MARALDDYLDIRWTALLDAVKDYVMACDANLDNGELCRDTWECYALCHWTNNPYTGWYETDLVDPAIEYVCAALSEFEVTVLLSWRWDYHKEDWDFDQPGGDFPRQLPLSSRRTILVDLFQRATYQLADSDGAEVEERQYFSTDESDET